MVRKAFVAASVCAFAATTAFAKGPVVYYFTDSPDLASDGLSQSCINHGLIITSQDDRHVQCEKEMNGFKGALTQVLIGNSYSTTPNQIVRFSISRGKGYSIVQATAWVETQMAFGQVRKQTLDGKKISVQLGQLMSSAGGSNYPPSVREVEAAQPSQAEEAVQAAPVVAPQAPPVAVQSPQPQTTSSPEPARFGNRRIKCVTCN